MAPEHLEAVVGLKDETSAHRSPVDGRADIYSLGVVLQEALGCRSLRQTEAGGAAAHGLGALSLRKGPGSRAKSAGRRA